eukprot:TRINITY_DN18099_c0_g1_i1.p1 TRINITY_DN18099_c0_g1~~TRINITY_DN18099_c0_g1_i1.p1  ORF type:complete len:370 (+),score=48.08 TRINITY_DN18099_c0_g1_i1:63-1172(+)
MAPSTEDSVSPDLLAFLFSIIGGISMGSYPVPIKAPSVMKANVNPLVFQCYKSCWVFILGFLFIVLNLIRGLPWFVFTYWGILGAAAWVPSGLGTIASVPRLGIAVGVVISTGTSATLQFAFGQAMGETMKKHGSPGHEYVIAPFYLIAVLVGMVGLVFAPSLKCGDTNQRESEHLTTGEQEGARELQHLTRTTFNSTFLIGLVCAVFAGVFSAVQYALCNIGKHAMEPDCTDCPEHTLWMNQFDSFGSYEISFGIGAALSTSLYLGLFVSKEKCQGNELPKSHFQLLRILGSIAGWCWVGGNTFMTAAVNRGGNSVMGPANQAAQLITSGAWGLIYYREVRGAKQIIAWLLSAVWTVAFVILLSREKE